MLHSISIPQALVATLALSTLSFARKAHDRSLGARSGPHHQLADSVLHKRADTSNIADVLAAIHSSLDAVGQQGASSELEGVPIAESHQANLASAVMLVAKSSQNAESAKAEGDREKALREKTEAAKLAKEKKEAAAKSASRHARVLAFKSSKSASLKTASSKKAASKLRSARKASSARKAASLSKASAASSREAAHNKSISAASLSKSKHSSSQSAEKALYSASKAASRAAKASSIASEKKLQSIAHFSSKSKAAAASASKAAAKSAAKAASVASSKSQTTKTTTAAKAASTGSKKGTVLAASSGSSSGGGLIGFKSSNCGSSQATDSEPNGSESFLNCGLSKSSPNSGWTPPKGITIDMLKTVSIETALASNSVWAPCKPYISLFEKWGAATGLPPIMLAAIALQESTCNPNDTGDNGSAVGLMQIVDKCDGRSTSACAEPDFNIGVGAKYLASQLTQYNNDVLLALGSYNGWYAGLTYSQATQAASSSCCACMQNLDYLYQMLNGWILGKTGYEMGSIGNLDVCGDE